MTNDIKTKCIRSKHIIKTLSWVRNQILCLFFRDESWNKLIDKRMCEDISVDNMFNFCLCKRHKHMTTHPNICTTNFSCFAAPNLGWGIVTQTSTPHRCFNEIFKLCSISWRMICFFSLLRNFSIMHWKKKQLADKTP